MFVDAPARPAALRRVALLLLVGLAAPTALAQAVLGPGLQRTLDALSPLQTTTVVVTFRGEGPPTRPQVSALRTLGITRGLTLRSLPVAGVVATRAQVAALARRSDVVSIWPNTRLTYFNADERALTGVDAARVDGDFQRANGGLPVSGRGVGVVINDSGVDGLHRDLAYGQNLVQNVLGSTNLNALVGILPITYVEGVPTTDTNSGHGTHVAGIVGGTGAASGGRQEGVAPGADLVGYGSGAALFVLDGLGGLDYALTHQAPYGIRVVTNSWGTTGPFDPADPIVQATYDLYRHGITVLFAAGNEGPAADTHNPYAQAPWVLSVAAGAIDGATLADFSSRGVAGESGTFTMPDGTTWTYHNEPDLTAPGVGVISACAAGSPVCATGIQPDNPFYTSLDGTSMATPHVAGVVALMYEADPTLSPDDVLRILRETATPMDYAAWEAGAGYVNAYAAVAAAFGFDPAPYLKDPTSGDGAGGDPGAGDGGTSAPPSSTAQPRAGVSVIDSGINPYHAFYYDGSEIYPEGPPSSVTTEVLDAFGVDAAHILHLTRTGDFAADYAADAAQWAAVRAGEVYWIAGTNILAVSFDPGSRILLPDDEDDTHGVGTSSAVLRANKDAIVLFVEGITDESEAFAFTHPEVDIVSTSYGAIGSLPLPYHINNSYLGVVTNGKLHVGAADNSPSTAVQDGTAGPWWSIGVAGFEEGTSEGKQLLSGSLPDVVADFTQTLPYCAVCEDGQQSVGGTSFATPRTAGTLSKILLRARRAAKHLGGITAVEGTPTMVEGRGFSITNWELRRALEEAAYVPTLDEYDPVEGAFDQLGLPVPPAGSYALVGWGVVTPDSDHDVVTEALAQLGFLGTPRAPKGADTCAFMTSVVTARHVYWDNLAAESESFMIDAPDPYIYCGASDATEALLPGGALATVAEAPFELAPNRPNPFGVSTAIAFSVPEAGHVRLAVYDLLGREVGVLVDEAREAGAGTATLRADALASGAYVVRLEATGRVATRTVTVVR